MGRRLFRTERTIIAALLDALSDQAPSPKDAGPLMCTRLLDGGDTDCDDAGVPLDKQCHACRVFTGLRITDDALNAIAEREFGRGAEELTASAFKVADDHYEIQVEREIAPGQWKKAATLEKHLPFRARLKGRVS